MPGVDGRVGLDEVLEVGDPDAVTPLGAHDAGRDGLAETERVADGHDPLADADGVRVCELEGLEPGGVDTEDGDVRLRVRSHESGLHRAPVVEPDGNARRVLDDVCVRQDHAVRGDDEARALAALRLRTLRGTEREGEAPHGGGRGLGRRLHLDEDDGLARVLGDLRDGVAQLANRGDVALRRRTRRHGTRDEDRREDREYGDQGEVAQA